MITHILEHYLFLMTCGRHMTNVWQNIGSGVHSPNHGQNDESKSGEGSVGNKGGWDTRKGRDNDNDGKETTTVMGRRQ